MSNILPKDLITPANKRFVHFMTHYFEGLTGFPESELIPIHEDRIAIFEERDGVGVAYRNHTFLIFPFIGNIAQAYDVTENRALHLKYQAGLPLFPAYASKFEFAAVGPFAVGWKFAIALTKKNKLPVKISPKGELLGELPISWLPREFRFSR